MTKHYVDWRRIAEPQDDEYDTRVALEWGGARLGRPATDIGPPSFLDGMVRVRHIAPTCPYDPPMVNAPLNHRTIAEAGHLLDSWPAAKRQIQKLVHTLHPLWDSSVPMDTSESPLSSCSGTREDLLGVIFATVENPITLAEALVHEMAHIKLFALEVSIERPSRLIVNDPRSLYESSVIRDRLRPMTAVVHAAYTFTHIAEFNLRLLGCHEFDHQADCLTLLAANLPAVERGVAVIKEHAEADADGVEFLKGYYAWAARVIEMGDLALSTNGVDKGELAKLAVT
jgi:HEXXH motif-containing protein